MALPNRPIGWSTEENLLWEISKQLEKLICVRAGCGGNTTTTTSTAAPITTTTSTTFFTREYCVWSTNVYEFPVETSEYDVATNTLTAVPIDNDLLGDVGMCSTSSKLWKFDVDTRTIREWFISSYPASLTFNLDYTLQDPGSSLSNVIAAKNNTLLISAMQNTNESGVIPYQVVLFKINLLANGTNPYPQSIGAYGSKLYSLPQSIMCTTDNKIIVTGIRTPGNPSDFWLIQYGWDEITGNFIFEMELDLSSIPFNPSALSLAYYLVTYAHEIYLIRSNDSSLFKIGLTYPYTITEVTADLGMEQHRIFESSAGECNDVSFSPQFPICGTTIPQLEQTFTYFGVTGTVTELSGGIIQWPYLLAGYFIECTGLWQPDFSWVATNTPTTITLTFDSPINDVSIILSILNLGDDFTITTNTEVPIVTTNLACAAHSSGNQIISDVNFPPGTNGSGQFTITTVTPYTVLTIVATNGGNGGPIGLSCDPNAPTTTSTTSSTTTLSPTGFNTIYTHFEAL